jgi:hypothetical protein
MSAHPVENVGALAVMGNDRHDIFGDIRSDVAVDVLYDMGSLKAIETDFRRLAKLTLKSKGRRAMALRRLRSGE